MVAVLFSPFSQCLTSKWPQNLNLCAIINQLQRCTELFHRRTMLFGDNTRFYISVKVYFFSPHHILLSLFRENNVSLNTGSVMGIYKIATSSCICRGCEKGVGSLSLCLRFSSETLVSTSQRHTRCVFVMVRLSHVSIQRCPLVLENIHF